MEYAYGIKGEKKSHNFIKKWREPHPTLSSSGSEKSSLNSDYFSFAFAITVIFFYKVQLRNISFLQGKFIKNSNKHFDAFSA